MAALATTPAATPLTGPPELARRKADPTSEDFQHEGSIFVSTANKKPAYVIHPDWVSEERPSLLPTRVKLSKSADNTGVQRGHFIIAPDWTSEGRRFPRFDTGRSHKPWPFEFKGARHWPDQSLDRRPPSVRASWGGTDVASRPPPTGLHLTENRSGWLPVTARAAIAPARGDGLPSYTYNRAYVTSYGEHFNKSALGAFRSPPDAAAPELARSAVQPWRSYNSWNVYSQELARSRREPPQKPSYMLPCNSSWIP